MIRSLSFFTFYALLSLQTYAEEKSITELKKTIEQLETRVAKLETICTDQAKHNQDAAVAISSDKKMWRKLKKGMKQEEVRKLLGEPIKISSMGFTRWFYSEEGGRSYVMFDDRDVVTGWEEPD